MNNLSRIRNDLMKQFFDDWMTPSFVVRPLHGRSLPEDFAVDIRENDQHFTIQAEMPGLRKEDIHVDIDGARITIGAEIKQMDQKVENDRAVCSERFYGTISRSFQLPSEVDSTGCNATYQDGILKLTLPKRSISAGKRIAIH
ncbi:MAG: Hsp20/alpha crystallin family protein [Betaproteobacteria bacterium]|jgi:HSP20 family protein|nr:Hsp20/alpha crystallin family protein [Betaproteobacteria bacterium]